MSTKPDKLDDFGDKIGGARKDLRGRVVPSDLAERSVEEAAKMSQRDYIWPAPDFEKLRAEMRALASLEDAGEPDEVVRAIKMVRDTMPPEPDASSGARGRVAYVAAVASLRDALMGVRSKQDFLRVWEDERVRSFVCVAQITQRGFADGKQRFYVDSFQSVNWGVARRRAFFYGDRSIVTAIEAGLNGRIPGRSVLGGVMKKNPTWPAAIDEVSRQLHKLQLTVNSDGNCWRIAWRERLLDEHSSDHIAYIAPGLKPILERSLDKGWESGMEARNALREPFEKSIADKKEKKRTERSQELSALLRGASDGSKVRDWRNGRAASPKDYIGLGSLRMRAGEFGNWVDASKRQELLDAGYDGFRDLADALEIPMDSVSLNGSLAVAFGARGSGPFAGHYEPGRKVINLTKPHGVGVLAHEWGHAFDHWAAIQVMKLERLRDLHPTDMMRPYLSDRVMALGRPPSDVLGIKGPDGLAGLTEEERAFVGLADAIFFLKFRNMSPATPEAYEAWMVEQRAAVVERVEKYVGSFADQEPCQSFVRQFTRCATDAIINNVERSHKRSTGQSMSRAEWDARQADIFAEMQPSVLRMARDFKALVSVTLKGDQQMIPGSIVFQMRDNHWAALPIPQIFTKLKEHAEYFAHGFNQVIAHENNWSFRRTLPRPEYRANEFGESLRKLSEYYQRPHEAFARAVETAVSKALRVKGCQSGFLVPACAADGGKGHPDGEIANAFTKAFLEVITKLPLQAPVLLAEDDAAAEVSFSEIEATVDTEEGDAESADDAEPDLDGEGVETIAEEADEVVMKESEPVEEQAWAVRPLAQVPDGVEVPEADREALTRVDEGTWEKRGYTRKGHLAEPVKVTRQQWIEDFLALGFTRLEERKAGKAPLRLRLSHPTKTDTNGRALFYECQHPAEMRYVRSRLAQIEASAGGGAANDNDAPLPTGSAAGPVK